MATASTNLVLHLMAIAHKAGVELTLDDFDRISREDPFVCNPQPLGKYPIVSLDDAGSIPAGLKTVESELNTGVMTCAGKPLSELLAGWELLMPPWSPVRTLAPSWTAASWAEQSL